MLGTFSHQNSKNASGLPHSKLFSSLLHLSLITSLTSFSCKLKLQTTFSLSYPDSFPPCTLPCGDGIHTHANLAVYQRKTALQHGLARCFRNEPHIKYFRLCKLVSATAIQPYVETARNNTETNRCGFILTQLYLQKHVAIRFGPWARVCQFCSEVQHLHSQAFFHPVYAQKVVLIPDSI